MRLSEIYTSVQGEGPGAGQMTQFIRFAGCNLRCPSWPCDTQHAIDPAYRKEWLNVTPAQIAAQLDAYPRRVVFTGGEPHLQPAQELKSLYDILTECGLDIEVFTNGTLEFPDWIAGERVSTIMDWKLTGSGEDAYNAMRLKNLYKLTDKDAVKFVIASRLDFIEARVLWSRWIADDRSDVQVYYGAAWDKLEPAELVAWVQEAELNWKLNVQIHNYIWNRNDRGI